eukprot:scaffold139309_cov30-Tisochrysis_lutea.AAC.4
MGSDERNLTAVRSPSSGLRNGRTRMPAGSFHPSLSDRWRASREREITSSLERPSSAFSRRATSSSACLTGASAASTSTPLAPRACSFLALESASSTLLSARRSSSDSTNSCSSSRSSKPSSSTSRSAVSSAFHSSDVDTDMMFLVACQGARNGRESSVSQCTVGARLRDSMCVASAQMEGVRPGRLPLLRAHPAFVPRTATAIFAMSRTSFS